jgi:hypothetical protein
MFFYRLTIKYSVPKYRFTFYQTKEFYTEAGQMGYEAGLQDRWQ